MWGSRPPGASAERPTHERRPVHTYKVTETNNRGWVAVCSCGWISAVHPLIKYRSGALKRLRVDVEGTQIRAVAEWKHHSLVTHTPLVPIQPQLAVGTVTRLGRFGHP